MLSGALFPTQVMRSALRTERQAMARGWARFTAATATSTASAAFAEGAQKMAMMEAYVVDLQQKVPRKPITADPLNHRISRLSTLDFCRKPRFLIVRTSANS